MSLFNKSIYTILSLTRNKNTLNIVNSIGNIDNYNLIVPNLYLGNINSANDVEFLKKNKIEAIINCTKEEPFNSYFDDKLKLRLYINDSKEDDNIEQFKTDIINTINFIEDAILLNKAVYVHCYWGLMRSATVVAAYLIKRYSMTHLEAISFIKEQRPRALSSIYNFNEILFFVENSTK